VGITTANVPDPEDASGTTLSELADEPGQARDDAAANINEDDFRVDYQAGQVLIRAGRKSRSSSSRVGSD